MDWAKAPRELLELPRIQQSVYAYLDLEAGSRGHCDPSQTEIGGAVGAGRRWVNIAIQGLIEADLISVEKSGKGRRYFIHNRGVQAGSRGPQLEFDVRPIHHTSDENVRPLHHTSSGHMSSIGHTSEPDVRPIHHTSEPLTSLNPREEEDLKQIPKPSSSSDPDPDARAFEIARCNQHDIEGLASRTTDGQFYHRKPDGSFCTFVPEPANASTPDPYARVYRTD